MNIGRPRAQRLVRGRTDGKLWQRASVVVIAKIVLVSDDEWAALQLVVDQGLLLVGGGHNLCLTDSGRRLSL